MKTIIYKLINSDGEIVGGGKTRYIFNLSKHLKTIKETASDMNATPIIKVLKWRKKGLIKNCF